MNQKLNIRKIFTIIKLLKLGVSKTKANTQQNELNSNPKNPWYFQTKACNSEW